MSLIGSIIGGGIIGALARFFMKGKQNMGMIVTIIIGMASAALADWLLMKVGVTNGFLQFVGAIVVAVVLISAYLGITNKKDK